MSSSNSPSRSDNWIEDDGTRQRLSLDELSLVRLSNQNQNQSLLTDDELLLRDQLLKRHSLPPNFSLTFTTPYANNGVAETQPLSLTMPKHGDLIPGKVTYDNNGRISVQASHRHFDPPGRPNDDNHRNSLPRSPAFRSLVTYQSMVSTRQPTQASRATLNLQRLVQDNHRLKKQNADSKDKAAEVAAQSARFRTSISKRFNELQVENEMLKKNLSRERQASTQNRSAADIKEIERLEELLQQERKGHELGRTIQNCKLQKAADELARVTKHLDQAKETIAAQEDALNTQKAVSRGLDGIIAARDRQLANRDQLIRTKDELFQSLRIEKHIAEEDSQRYADALLRTLNETRRARRLLTESQSDVLRLQAQVNRLQHQRQDSRAAWKRQESHRWSTMQTLVDDSASQNSKSKEEEEDEQEGCTICLEPYSRNDNDDESQKRAFLPCGHAFHAGCVRDWHSRSFNCPYCRQGFEWQLAKRATPTGPAAAGADTGAADDNTPQDSDDDDNEGPEDDDIISTVFELDRQAIRDELMGRDDGGTFAAAGTTATGGGGRRPDRRPRRRPRGNGPGVSFGRRLRRTVKDVRGWLRIFTG